MAARRRSSFDLSVRIERPPEIVFALHGGEPQFGAAGPVGVAEVEAGPGESGVRCRRHQRRSRRPRWRDGAVTALPG